ncbi:hypothetical protein ANN_10425 [Periplaneta americana]|uniref:Uncharacterized protein n=1 Tax=Periplaneta americana TaxID=6978 RepID=A0ABQ8TPB7_PERAM|nr:hypothetical protein ANN_10425 [Periplaneta americana]
MARLCEGGNEPSGSLKAICNEEVRCVSEVCCISEEVRCVSEVCCFKLCHGSWLADEPRESNLPTLPQRRITYEREKLPSKYGVHSEEYVPIRTVTPVVAGM